MNDNTKNRAATAEPNRSRPIRAWLSIGLLLAAAIIVPVSVLAEGTPENPDMLAVPTEPQPLPPYMGWTGYYWDELDAHTHIMMAVSDPQHKVLLSSLKVGTQFVDLEVVGLPNEAANDAVYTLQGHRYNGDPVEFMGAVASDGTAVFWGLPPEAMTLTLRDPHGQALLTVNFQSAGVEAALCRSALNCSPGMPTPPPMAAGAGGGGGGGSSGATPQPTSYQTSTGQTLVQGAISNTYYGKVTATGCWNHQVGVAVKVSAGGTLGARGSAGATYTYSTGKCDTIYANGPGTRETQNDGFTKATYSDGSYRVYANSKGNSIAIQNWNVQGYCTGGGTGCFETLIMKDCKDFSRTVTESGAGSATISLGYQTPAWGVEGSVTVGATSSSSVKFDITHYDCGQHTYYLAVMAGNRGQTGLIGILQV